MILWKKVDMKHSELQFASLINGPRGRLCECVQVKVNIAWAIDDDVDCKDLPEENTEKNAKNCWNRE